MIEWFRNLNQLYNLIRPVLDVSILAFIIYKAYDLLVRTQAIQIIKGAGLLFICYGLAYFLKLTTLLWVLNFLAPGLFIAIAIVFQPELRKIFLRLGQGELFHLASQPTQTVFEPVLTAAEILSKQKRGALFVFARKVNLRTYIESGTRLNAELCSNLLITIFAYDGPLHDGAVVIQNGKILAAGCFLPLSEQQDIRKTFGTRHRAALGISEVSDAIVIIVSEETGAISLAYDGKLYYDLSSLEIQRKLTFLLEGERTTEEESPEEPYHETAQR